MVWDDLKRLERFCGLSITSEIDGKEGLRWRIVLTHRARPDQPELSDQANTLPDAVQAIVSKAKHAGWIEL